MENLLLKPLKELFIIMRTEFYWEFDLSQLLFTAFIVFRNVALIIFTQKKKKTEIHSKNFVLLLVAGILLMIWSGISYILPGFRFYIDSDYEIFTLFLIFDIFPTIFDIFLGVALALYFYKAKYSRRPLLGPVMFIAGSTSLLLFNIVRDYIFVFVYSIYYSLNEIFIFGYAILILISVVGFFFIFLYSIKVYNDFFIMFCGLFFATLLATLIYRINYIFIVEIF